MRRPRTTTTSSFTISQAIFAKPELAECYAGGVPTGDGHCALADAGGNPVPGTIGPGNPLGSPAFATVRENMQERIQQSTKHFTGNVNAAYQPWSQLSVEGTFGVDVVNQVSTDFAPFGHNVDHFIGFDTLGFKTLDDRTFREITAEAKATWTRHFGERFASTLVAGGQGFVVHLEDAAETGEQFPGPGLEVVGAGANPTTYERRLETVNAGAFAQEQLGYKDFAFFTAGARYDRNSAFGKTSEGVWYPKASISVLPSALSGWGGSALTSKISTLRLRAAIGQSGLQPGAFAKFTTFEPLASSAGPGLTPSNLGNLDLRPEKTTEWEVGSEIGVLGDRAAVDLTYWNRVTRDALYPRQFAPSGGFRNTQLTNIGRIDAHGWEIAVTGLPISKPDLSIKEFDNVFDLLACLRPFGAGNPCGLKSLSDVLPIRVDENGNGDFLDHYLGKSTPDWAGSFGLTATILRNFELSSLFEYKTGNYTITNLTYGFRNSNAVIGRNSQRSAAVEAALLNPNSTLEQRLAAAKEWLSLRALTPYDGLNQNENGKFLRWRELSLTYNVPTDWASRKLGLRYVSLTAGVRNLALWTGYKGIDPELNVYGRGTADAGLDLGGVNQNFGEAIDAFGLALPRRYTFSVRLGS